LQSVPSELDQGLILIALGDHPVVRGLRGVLDPSREQPVHEHSCRERLWPVALAQARVHSSPHGKGGTKEFDARLRWINLCHRRGPLEHLDAKGYVAGGATTGFGDTEAWPRLLTIECRHFRPIWAKPCSSS